MLQPRHIFLILALIVMLGAIFLFAASSKEADDSSKTDKAPVVVPERMSLEGEFVCLPKTGGGPITEECASGLRTADGTYYALDTAMASAVINLDEVEVGDTVKGNGVFVPIEMLSSDRWRSYPIKGIFSITDGFVHDKQQE